MSLDKVARLLRIIRQHGGVFKSLSKLWFMDTLKEGKLMGKDCFGNKYYENEYYMIGRSRWVEYSPTVKFEYDATMDHLYAILKQKVLPKKSIWLSSCILFHHHAGTAEPILMKLDTIIACSSIPPEWHGWLHYKTDRLPSEDWAKYCVLSCSWSRRWLLPPEENMSGSKLAYVPYSTTQPSIVPWDGRSICNRPCLPIQ